MGPSALDSQVPRQPFVRRVRRPVRRAEEAGREEAQRESEGGPEEGLSKPGKPVDKGRER